MIRNVSAQAKIAHDEKNNASPSRINNTPVIIGLRQCRYGPTTTNFFFLAPRRQRSFSNCIKKKERVTKQQQSHHPYRCANYFQKNRVSRVTNCWGMHKIGHDYSNREWEENNIADMCKNRDTFFHDLYGRYDINLHIRHK
jgi:hypothetical protein